MTSRFIVLGLARPRVAWFADVARWSTGAALPVEFIKCVSPQEVRIRVGSGRRFSAALLDAGTSGLDRDLIGVLRDAGVAALVVEDGHVATDWVALGAAAVLPQNPGRADILDAMSQHAAMVDGIDLDPLDASDQPMDLTHRGQLVAVTGPAGVGVSSTAIALAQGLATNKNVARRTLLADLCLTAELALLHDARDVVPGLPELLDAHRGRRPDPRAIADLTWHVEERGYDLLLGLRRSSDWPTLREKSLLASIDGMRRTWDTIVADVDATVEGEDATGSMDVQDRHMLARAVLGQADRIVIVSRPGMKWVHGAVRVMSELAEFGVDAQRIQTVVLGVSRRPKVRADVAKALADLAPRSLRAGLASPVFLPDRDPDLTLRDGLPLPAPLVDPITTAIAALLSQPTRPMAAEATTPVATAAGPQPIKPGELGFFVTDNNLADSAQSADGEDAA